MEKQMKTNLYGIFAVIAIVSAVIALIRIAIGHHVADATIPNIVIGSICVALMVILNYKWRRKIARRN